MSLPLVTRFGADPLLALEIANKQYVDNASSGLGLFDVVRKDANEIVNNSSAFQDDDELFIPLPINRTFWFQLFLKQSSASNADIKYKFTLPAGASMLWAKINTFLSKAVTSSQVEATNGTVNYLPTCIGFVIMGGTSGNLTTQWAQNVAQASDTTIHEDSMIIARENINP